MRKLLTLCCLMVIGCGGVNPGTNPGPVDFSGKVTRNGKPVSEVTFNLQPTGHGSLPAVLPVKNGEIKGKVNPGRYTFFFSDGPNPAAIAAIPEKYREGTLERQIEVAEGTPLTITLD